MIEVKGAFNEAKIYTDKLEGEAENQIRLLCDQEFVKGSRIRIMPDVHAGAGCTIGTTMTITDKVVPNLVGVDIGCGMEAIRIGQKRLELQKLDKLIYEKIPSGRNVRSKAHRYGDDVDLSALRCAKEMNIDRAYLSIGTLGGGNHFIEVDRDDSEALYIVVHSGSRHLGLEVANYYQEAGFKALNKNDQASLDALIVQYKAEGRDKEIQSALKALKKQVLTTVPFALAYVSGGLFDDYVHDMRIVQRFAEIKDRKSVV
jgi:tRNA-splicing ligase RtcB